MSKVENRDHFAVMSEALKHPVGRAIGGEPCVQCSEPVPANAAWQHRDRLVCSARCNRNLARKFNRGSKDIPVERVQAAKAIAIPPDPRLSLEPRVFRTVANEHVPFEWEGYGPRPGDIVERYGVQTRYFHADRFGFHDERVLVAYVDESNCFVTGTTGDGYPSRLVLGQVVDGVRVHASQKRYFMVAGVECEWRWELLTDLHHDGVRHFTWEAYVAIPVGAPPYPPSLQSPRYRAEMDRRRRIQSNTTRNSRRALEDAVIEDFDPHEVFERDGWYCQLCGIEVDRFLLYPHLESASLDHVRPLVAGGHHTRANSQLAHLRCNLRKRDRQT